MTADLITWRTQDPHGRDVVVEINPELDGGTRVITREQVMRQPLIERWLHERPHLYVYSHERDRWESL